MAYLRKRRSTQSLRDQREPDKRHQDDSRLGQDETPQVTTQGSGWIERANECGYVKKQPRQRLWVHCCSCNTKTVIDGVKCSNCGHERCVEHLRHATCNLVLSFTSNLSIDQSKSRTQDAIYYIHDGEKMFKGPRKMYNYNEHGLREGEYPMDGITMLATALVRHVPPRTVLVISLPENPWLKYYFVDLHMELKNLSFILTTYEGRIGDEFDKCRKREQEVLRKAAAFAPELVQAKSQVPSIYQQLALICPEEQELLIAIQDYSVKGPRKCDIEILR
ncbi:hypothetical protein AJ80_09792 [Polytolypa hystricis UAMH7299]|uniref:Uncharacterized protein n=1 Tax=Polytolypa hystricis (strain UAMH7299) TaxID=1447883 RepID=A0A2B7WJN0_POLH7|nr:hypothetical protein AJ80_09792 [Polytolypa hystricis UAMH7299]